MSCIFEPHFFGKPYYCLMESFIVHIYQVTV